MGSQVGRYNTTGGNNNFFGCLAGRGSYYFDPETENTYAYGKGCNNNFFGTCAGLNIREGRNNNFFGTCAGLTNENGSNNIIIGACADTNTNNLSGVIVLGTGAFATQSHQIVLSTANISMRTLRGTSQGPNVFIGDSRTGKDTST